MLITSPENKKIKQYIKLKDKKYRDESQTFLVEGLHLVLEAYKTNNIIELIIEQDEVLPFDLPCIYVTKEIINKISTLDNPCNIMALCKMPAPKTYGKKLLLLDKIQDPGNLGTIIRSAKAFNIDTIVLNSGCCDLYNPKVIRACQGINFHIDIISKDLTTLIKELKIKEIPIYGTKVEYGEDIRLLKAKDKTTFALVMGNEGQGVSPDILNMCDKYIYIDINSQVESLNVAIATSILLYELNR